jgi:hypothetical protein
VNIDEYKKHFEGNIPGDGKKTRAEKALDIAIDIRKFEIELYWKRATYFWTFIGAAFAGYAVSYEKANIWLQLIFSCLGLLFSFSWFLVNSGSKFWQNNWERHVDLLEVMVIGPLYETIAHCTNENCFLTAPAQFSVSKINQILSFFISLFWVLLIAKSLCPVSCSSAPDCFKIGVLTITAVAIAFIFTLAKSKNKKTKMKLTSRIVTVESNTNQ